jgi:hypothetical protein
VRAAAAGGGCNSIGHREEEASSLLVEKGNWKEARLGAWPQD